MTEVEATIPENSPGITEAETNEIVEEPAAQVPEPPESKRGRGRPAGSKDKAPRATKPKVRAEPITQPIPQPTQLPTPQPIPQKETKTPRTPTVVEERPPSPEPASPRTLFRQTSEHLLNLRDVMNSQKRASAADRYTSRLHAWPVI